MKARRIKEYLIVVVCIGFIYIFIQSTGDILAGMFGFPFITYGAIEYFKS